MGLVKYAAEQKQKVYNLCYCFTLCIGSSTIFPQYYIYSLSNLQKCSNNQVQILEKKTIICVNLISIICLKKCI